MFDWFCFGFSDNPSKTVDDWKALTEDDKEVYKKKAAEDKERYRKEMEAYNDVQQLAEKATKGKKDRRGGK